MIFQEQGDTLTNGQFTIYIQKIIGQGNYGIVYECLQVNSRNPLCAKIIKPQVSTQEYLIREAQILNTLKDQYPYNPNLVKVYSCQYQQITFKNQQSDYLIIIMERCESNLKDELKKTQIFTVDMVVDFFKQLLNGYKPLFEKCIIHRDLKPENILISRNQEGKVTYKISDFGIGKICQQQDTVLTKAGTPAYAAPELNMLVDDGFLDEQCSKLRQQKCGKSYVDVYSIGIILYQLLLGQLPFEVQSPHQLQSFFKNMKNNPLKIPRQNQNVNNDLLDMIENMIIYDPVKRMKITDIYCHQLINVKPETPKKFGNIEKISKQQTVDQKIPIFFNNTNQQQNLRFTLPNNPQNISFPNNKDDGNGLQNQPRMGTNPAKFIPPNYNIPITNPIRNQNMNTSTNQNQNENMNKNQSLQNVKFDSAQIKIDEIQDSLNYLQTQLLENNYFYCEQTKTLFKETIDLITKPCQENKIFENANKLFGCYKFDLNAQYSLSFLKFYYCVLARVQGSQIRNLFNNEADLRSEIGKILQQIQTRQKN